MGQMGEVWILGATGRIGRGVASELAAAGLSPVLVGRSAPQLHELAQSLPESPKVVDTVHSTVL